MKTLNTINHPIRSMMKPLPVIESRDALRERQEDCVYSYLTQQTEALCTRTVAEKCGDIPGIDMRRGRPLPWQVRGVSAILKRLEAKGHVLSTLYCGKRYYSVPVTGGDK